MTTTLLALLACGYTCGEGTHPDGKTCVADDLPPDDTGDPSGDTADSSGDSADTNDTNDTADSSSDTDDTAPPSWTVCATGAPYVLIQDAIDASENGDVIAICAGTYEEVLDFGYHDVSLVGEDAATTILDGGGTAPVVSVIRGESDARIRGLTITGGQSDADPTILVESSTFTMQDVVVTGNASSWSNTLYASDEAVLTIEDSVLADNECGAGVLHVTGSTASLVRNQIHDNYAVEDVTRVMIRFTDSTADFFNNAVWDNTGTALQLDYPTSTTVLNNTFYSSLHRLAIEDPSGATAFLGNIVFGLGETHIDYDGASTYEHSTLYAASSWWGAQNGADNAGMLSQPPRFVDPDAGDFTLDSLSPCIDAGPPGSQYNDADGTTNDQGVHGGPFAR